MPFQKSFEVLIIEDDQRNAEVIITRLTAEDSSSLTITKAHGFDNAGRMIRDKNPDIVLSALSSDAADLSAGIQHLLTVAGDRPLVVIFDEASSEQILTAARHGVQDYIVSSKTDERSISQIIYLALERHRLKKQLEQIAMQDELTQVHNRRGFFALAEQQLKLAKRNNCEFLLFFMDLDGLKQINDRFGHEEGDIALSQAAGILRRTFRQSDIIARLGGDEFAVLAVEAGSNHHHVLAERLRENLEEFNASQKKDYRLSLSIGAECYDPKENTGIEKLLTKADDKLYEKKRKTGAK